jgi:hypothetical protein
MEVAEKSLHTKVPDISIFTKMSILRKEEEKGNLFMTKCKYRDAGIATVAARVRLACLMRHAVLNPEPRWIKISMIYPSKDNNFTRCAPLSQRDDITLQKSSFRLAKIRHYVMIHGLAYPYCPSKI